MINLNFKSFFISKKFIILLLFMLTSFVSIKSIENDIYLKFFIKNYPILNNKILSYNFFSL